MAVGISDRLWTLEDWWSKEPVRQGAFQFTGGWQDKVRALPETGMGYTSVCVTLRDGRAFDAIIDSGWLSRVRDRSDVPFAESDIAAIKPTHDKWHSN